LQNLPRFFTVRGQYDVIAPLTQGGVEDMPRYDTIVCD
jgi:hypothetical protein